MILASVRRESLDTLAKRSVTLQKESVNMESEDLSDTIRELEEVSAQLGAELVYIADKNLPLQGIADVRSKLDVVIKNLTTLRDNKIDIEAAAREHLEEGLL